MSEPAPQKSIIIKKVKKVVGGGHHGGSWKVAYADFVTAMMAFFLLLWLLSMVSPEKKAGISYYFRSFTIFPKDGAGLLDKEMIKMMEDQNLNAKPKFSTLPPDSASGAKNKGGGLTVKSMPVGMQAVGLKEKIQKRVRHRLAALTNHLSVSMIDEGVRIEIMDVDDDFLFPKGGVKLNPNMRTILKQLNEDILRRLDNKIVIEGHTDAEVGQSTEYTNWEISTDRALEVRKQLELYGLNPERLSMIVGYAATRPLFKEKPLDPKNRRISIIILTSELDPAKKIHALNNP
jgi:chemotaxis protein MotB